MKFYVTSEKFENVKNAFLNFRSFSIINVQEIIDDFGYDKNNLNEYQMFIINDEIQNVIKDSVVKKKYFNIIYINEDLNTNVIESLKESIDDYKDIEKFVFIDDKEDKSSPNFKLYPLFDEIVFFPKTKRIKIVHCETIKNPLFYWLNSIQPDK